MLQTDKGILLATAYNFHSNQEIMANWFGLVLYHLKQQ